MEQLLLQLINEEAPAPYSDSDNQQLAAYIMGETTFEKIRPLLKVHKNRWYYYTDPKTRKIAKDITQDKETMLPRVGRFCRILRHVGSDRRVYDFLANVLQGVIPATEIYTAGGMGIEDLLTDTLDALPEYWAFDAKNLGFKSYPQFFSHILENHPEAYEKLAQGSNKPAYALFASSYLYAANPAKYAHMEDCIITLAGPLLNKKTAEEAIAAAQEEPAFANSPFIKQLRQHSRKNIGAKADKFAMDMFYMAYAKANSMRNSPDQAQPSSILLDIISYLLIYCEKHDAFASMSKAEQALNNKQDGSIYEGCIAKAKRGILPMTQFLAYSGNAVVGSQSNIKLLKELVLQHEAHTIKATKLTDIRGGIILLSAFWEKGQLQDKLAAYEKKVVLTLDTKDADLLAYFLGNALDLPNRVPMLDINDYNLAWTVAYMVPYSQLPARLVNYALTFNRWPNFLGFLLKNINDYFGDEPIAKFVDEIPAPVHEKIASLVNSAVYVYSDAEKALLTKEATCLASTDTQLYEKAFANASADARVTILNLAYNQEPDYNPDWLIAALGDNSKKVRDTAIAYMTSKTQYKPQIEELAKSKKKAQRESAEKLLMAYNATGKESDSFDPLAYVIANIPAKAAKTIEWVGFDTLPKVRLNINANEAEAVNGGSTTHQADANDGDTATAHGYDTTSPDGIPPSNYADDRIIIGYIYLMVTQNEMALPRPATMIRETLNKSDLRILGQQLYHVWKNSGAQAKHRAVLALAAIDGDDNFVRALTKDIHTWAEASRGALAAEATRALALQGGSLALMTVDSFSKKFKNKQVKRVAEEAFQFAAKELGVDPEVLGDRIVPTLGFDNRGQQIIDYGNRQFTATITPDLQISLKTDQGKAIKTLPTPGASDDKDKAASAKADFTTMKKNLKSVATLQCLRLEQALSSNRTWTKEAWNQLFVENPIMNMFAIGLIWGTYEQAADTDTTSLAATTISPGTSTTSLVTSFRYMEDGSFVTADEDDFHLSDNAQIGLCHPLDLGEALTATWKQQLEDYEITQPIDQLSRKVFKAPADKKATTVTDFGGAVVYAVSLWGKLQKMGWYRGSVVDAGGYFNFYKEDSKLGLGVLLDFSGTYVGADNSEEVTVYDAVFYKAGTVNYGSYVYDEVKEDDRIPLHQVPARFYSEACYDIERATANRIDTIENWVKNR